jgi:hypothetical protein
VDETDKEGLSKETYRPVKRDLQTHIETDKDGLSKETCKPDLQNTTVADKEGQRRKRKRILKSILMCDFVLALQCQKRRITMSKLPFMCDLVLCCE